MSDTGKEPGGKSEAQPTTLMAALLPGVCLGTGRLQCQVIHLVHKRAGDSMPGNRTDKNLHPWGRSSLLGASVIKIHEGLHGGVVGPRRGCQLTPCSGEASRAKAWVRGGEGQSLYARTPGGAAGARWLVYRERCRQEISGQVSQEAG